MALFLITQSGCNTDSSLILPRPTGIIGTWDWIRSRTMFGFVTPADAGETSTVRYDPDSTFHTWLNDSLVHVGRFKIVRQVVGPTIKDSADVLMIEDPIGRGSGWDSYLFHFEQYDTLVLTGLALDDGPHWYKRIR